MTTISAQAASLLSNDSPIVRTTAESILALDAEKDKTIARLQRELQRLQKKLAKQMAAAKALRSSNASLQRQIARKDVKIEKLADKLQMMTKQAFGSKPDKLNIGPAPTEEEEAALLAKLAAAAQRNESKDKAANGEPEKKPKKPKDKKKKGKGRQPRRYGKNVEIDEQFHGPDTCPCGCGGSRRNGKPIEEVVTVPARQVIVKHVYPVYRCRLHGKLVPFVRDKKLFPGKSLSGGTIAYFAALKFDWFMPTYRQERIFKQEGTFVHRGTISRCLNALAGHLRPIAETIYQDVMDNSCVLHADDTVHYRLIGGHGKVKKRCLVSIVRDERGWGGHRFPAACYRVFSSSSQATYEALFGGQNVIVTHDGHGSFNRFGQAGTTLEGITSTGCWAHARRYFVDAHNIGGSRGAQVIVEHIDRIFELESRMRGSTPRVRRRVRRRCAKPVTARIFAMLQSIIDDYPQDGRMGRAIRYVQKRRTQLTAFLEDGRVEMHNNNVERSFKSPILLRNASLFSASEEGEKAWAIFFTLSETCRLNGVNFYRYLLWVMDKIARMGDEVDYKLLLPWNAPDHCFTAVDEAQPRPIDLPEDP